MSVPKTILSPFNIGGQTLKNRIVLAPLTRGRSDASRNANELMATYYEQRASAGLLITEATAVSDQGFGWRNAPGLYTEEMANSWKQVVDRVHAKSGLIYLQLWHMGRQSHSSHHAKTHEIVSASDIAIQQGQNTDAEGKKVPYEVPRALRTDEIPGVVEQYRSCAALAKQVGFDGVEIHAANGYLIDQFLQSCSNKRTDQYGGSFENRTRLLLEVIEALKTVYPANRIGFRISPNGAFGDMGGAENIELFTYVGQATSGLGLAYCHMMDGLGFGYHNKCRPMTVADLRKVFSGPIISNIGLTEDMAEGMLRSGVCDLTAFGRLFISNPDLVERFTNNWPLNPMPDHTTFWADNVAKGYTDWPTYKPKTQYCQDPKCFNVTDGKENCEKHEVRPLAVGDELPALVLSEFKEVAGEACSIGPNAVDIAKASAGKTIVVFGLPGAFTPTCSAQHVPSYVEHFDELKKRGVDEIWCVSVNDAFVMGAWARELKTEGKVRMLADGSGAFAKATGLVLDLTAKGMGVRSCRYSLLARNGKVQILNVEQPGKFEVSGATTMLQQLA